MGSDHSFGRRAGRSPDDHQDRGQVLSALPRLRGVAAALVLATTVVGCGEGTVCTLEYVSSSVSLRLPPDLASSITSVDGRMCEGSSCKQVIGRRFPSFPEGAYSLTYEPKSDATLTYEIRALDDEHVVARYDGKVTPRVSVKATECRGTLYSALIDRR